LYSKKQAILPRITAAIMPIVKPAMVPGAIKVAEAVLMIGLTVGVVLVVLVVLAARVVLAALVVLVVLVVLSVVGVEVEVGNLSLPLRSPPSKPPLISAGANTGAVTAVAVVTVVSGAESGNPDGNAANGKGSIMYKMPTTLLQDEALCGQAVPGSRRVKKSR